MLSSLAVVAAILLTVNNKVGSAVAVYIPGDQQCRHPQHWQSRSCQHSDGGDSGWRDFCQYQPNHGRLVSYSMEEVCGPNLMCVDLLAQDPDDPQPKSIVSCIPRPTGDPVAMADAQSGVVYVVHQASIPLQHTATIRILQDLTEATVSAVIEVSSEHRPISVPSPIEGFLHGTPQTLCAYNPTTFYCVPTVRYSKLSAGDEIDFTFGLLGNGTEALYDLYYAVWSTPGTDS